MKTLNSTTLFTFIFGLVTFFSTHVLLAQETDGECPYYFRTADGGCNNFEQTEWGKSGTQFIRSLPSQYGPPDFKYSFGGQGRMNPRAISNLVCFQTEDTPSKHNLSSFVYSWGQFLDHDITETPGNEEDKAPILLPEDEPLFRIPIDFNRSRAHEGTGVDNPRQQTNVITHWIDASNVYGSDDHHASWLRTYEGGKLKMSKGNFLPYNTIDGEYNSPVDPNAPEMAGQDQLPKLFVAGDVRANEQPGLLSLHTLFVREHNRICDEFIAHGYYDDESNYLLARSIVGAYIQTITYNEYLPAIGVELDPYVWYDPAVRPEITTEFATAAFRYGHSLVQDHLLLADEDFFAYDVVELKDAFFKPSFVAENDIQPVLLGLMTQHEQENDLFLIDNLRNFLFAPSPNAPGIDLAALNIQRGRDHGLPDYNTMRTHYLGTPATKWSDITSDPALQARMKAAYGNNLNDVDLWVGLQAEDHVPGTSLGATSRAILKDQFQRLRDADRFYYEIDPIILNWGEDLTNDIRLSTIIIRNTDATFVPFDVFHVYDGSLQGLQKEAVEVKTNAAVANFSVLRDLKTLAYPNPTNGVINVKLDNENQEDLNIDILNKTGQIVKTITKAKVGSHHQEQFDLSNLPNGIYSIKLKIGEQVKSEKVILSKTH